MATKLHQLDQLLRPAIEALGYICWGIEYVSSGRQSVLRIYIDSDTGVLVDDCEKVSRQVSGILDVEDPIPTEYQLEVSSPGMDRPLFELAQYERFIGHPVMIRLRMPFEGRRKYQGIIRGIENAEVILLVGEDELLFPFESIDRANIVPVFE